MLWLQTNKLSVFNISSEVIDAARAFAREQDPRPVLYIVSPSSRSDYVWKAVTETLKSRHGSLQEVSVEDLLREVNFAKDDRQEKLDRLCYVIVSADLLEMRSLWEYSQLKDEIRKPILQALDERSAACKRTVIVDNYSLEWHLNRYHLQQTMFFKDIVLCDLTGDRLKN